MAGHRRALRRFGLVGSGLAVIAVAGFLVGACGGGEGEALTTRTGVTATRPAATVTPTRTRPTVPAPTATSPVTTEEPPVETPTTEPETTEPEPTEPETTADATDDHCDAPDGHAHPDRDDGHNRSRDDRRAGAH